MIFYAYYHPFYIVRFTLFQGEKGWTPLLVAASNGQLESVRFLSSAGADINAKNNKGETAVYRAACGYLTIRFMKPFTPTRETNFRKYITLGDDYTNLSSFL